MAFTLKKGKCGWAWQVRIISGEQEEDRPYDSPQGTNILYPYICKVVSFFSISQLKFYVPVSPALSHPLSHPPRLNHPSIW
jgi:hypothetical protein